MIPSNQKVTLLYHTVANSLEVNKRYMNIRQRGIYKGGWLSKVSNHPQMSSLVCEISDTNYQVRVEITAATDFPVIVESDNTPYIVLRWVYAGSPTNYMQLLAVAAPAANGNDLVVGKCTFDGGGALLSFIYDDVLYPRSNPNVQDLFLKVEETGDSDMRVRIRGGRIQTSSVTKIIEDQKSDTFLNLPTTPNSKVYLVWIDTTTDPATVNIDSSGTPGNPPVVPDYAGRLVIAEVTLAYNATSIPQSKIKDVRSFITNTPPIGDDVYITKDVNGKFTLVGYSIGGTKVSKYLSSQILPG
jgi:hypothetical protein